MSALARVVCIDSNGSNAYSAQLMELIPTAEGARRADVSINTFIAVAERLNIEPIAQGAGVRGPKFWSAESIDRIIDARRADLLARLDRLDAAS